jgi:hypothetical protein
MKTIVIALHSLINTDVISKVYTSDGSFKGKFQKGRVTVPVLKRTKLSPLFFNQRWVV